MQDSRSHRRVRYSAIALAIAGCAGFAADRADASNRTWGNAAGGTFSTAANWMGGVAPTNIDLPIFQLNSAAGYTVTFVAPAQTTGMTMQSDNVTFALGGGTYTVNGALLLSTSNGNENAKLAIGGGTLSATSTQLASSATNTASVTVSTGGFASLGSTTIGGSGLGTLTAINGGDVSAGAMTLGASSSGAGTMAFVSSGTTLTAGATVIGGAGSGYASLLSGATASTGVVTIGQSNGGAGTMQLAGGGWTSSGQVVIGPTSSGDCNIVNAGSLTSVGGQIGGGPSTPTTAIGRVTINGSGSRWINNGSLMINRGTLSVVSGGTMSASSTALFCPATPNGETPISPALVARGTSTVLNCGTQLMSFGGGLTTGAAVIDISNGAAVSANVVQLAASAESVCDATVDGQNSQLTSSVAFMQIANFVGARGTLRVRNHASAFGNGGLTMASVAGSSGTIELSNRGTFSCNFDALIGGSSSTGGVGYLSVTDDATLALTTTGNLKIFGNSRLVLDGGTVSVGSLNLFTGSRFDWNSGTLAIIGNSGASIASNASLGNRVTLVPGQTLSAPVGTTVAAGGLLALDGGALRTGFLNLNAGGEVDLRDNGSIFNASFSNVQGLIHGDGRLDMNLSVGTGGEVRAENGKRLSFFDPGTATHSNGGQLTLFGGTLEFGSPLFNGSAGRITGRGTLIAPGTGVDNFGTMTFSAGTSDVMARVTNRANAKVIVTGGSTTTFFSPITTETNSELRVSTGSTAVFLGSVTGPGAITGAGVKDFEDHATQLRISGTGTTHIGPAGDVSADVLRDDALIVEGTIGIASNGTSASVMRVGALTIDPAGQLDLANNDAILTATSPSTVFTYLQSGYNFGGQDGIGGIVSSAARNNPNGNTTLGMLTGDEYLNNTGDPNFDGVAVNPTDVLIKYTYFGDVDFNGSIDASDYNLIDFGFVNGLTGWGFGDADYSGGVDVSDYNLIDFAFSTQNGTLRRAIAYLDGTDRTSRGMNDDPSLQVIAQHFSQFGETYASGFLATVPEPTTMVLAPAVVSFLLARRARRTPRTRTL